MNAPQTFANAMPLTAPRYRTLEECREIARPVNYGPFGSNTREQIAQAMFAICGPGTTKLAEYEIKRVGSGVVL